MMVGGRKLTNAQKLEIANELQGSCSNPDQIADHYDLDIFDGGLEVTIAANDHGVYLCECCGWWHDESEMDNHEGEMWCSDCLEEDVPR